jgi:hypothetical protein
VVLSNNLVPPAAAVRNQRLRLGFHEPFQHISHVKV